MFWKNAKLGRRRPWSITTRLTVLFAATGFTLLLAGGLFLYWALERNLDQEDTQFLADKVYVLRAVFRERPNDNDALNEEVNWEGAARQFSRYYTRVLDENGRLIRETAGMEQLVPSSVFPSPIALDESPRRVIDYKSPTGKVFSLIAAWAQAGKGGPKRMVQVALDASSEEAFLAAYRRNLALVLICGLAIATFAGRVVARRGLAPLHQVTEAARGITVSHLDARLGVQQWPAELTELADAFDEMLARLHDSFRRLSQFSADIAHELRTPVTSFMTESQVTLSRARSADEYRAVIESGIEEFGRLAQMIDTLLFLARAENAPSRVQNKPLDARSEAEKVIEFHRAAAEEQGVELSCEGSATICADVVLFQRALSNLLTNAVRHTQPGGKVGVKLAQSAPQAGEVEVTDTGEGIRREHLPHIFDRFYRADASRTQKTGGFGLGLALVKSIMSLHGGEALLTSEVGKGTSVKLRFPPHADALQS